MNNISPKKLFLINDDEHENREINSNKKNMNYKNAHFYKNMNFCPILIMRSFKN